MQNRDIQSVRVVGMFAFGIGAVLLVLTIMGGLIALFSGFSDTSQFLQGAVGSVTAVIMASTLLSSGTTMATMRPAHVDPEMLRLTWTALFVVMLLGALVNLWLIPALTVVASLVMLALLLIRAAVIRLTTA